jgi:hypothetical protein
MENAKSLRDFKPIGLREILATAQWRSERTRRRIDFCKRWWGRRVAASGRRSASTLP